MLQLLSAQVMAQPCANHTTLRQPFFGDLHVHTRYSLDAATQGTLTSPAQAYQFAKGQALGIQPWLDGRPQRTMRLTRPLDFAMVSDHAELLGEVAICDNPEHPATDTWQCQMYRKFPRGAYYWFNYWSAMQAERVGFCDGKTCQHAAAGPWQDMQKAAAEETVDCQFSAFVGYEWTGGKSGDKAGNIHRNVVFKNLNVPTLPVSYLEQQSPYGLFDALDQQCQDDCGALVIPHNSNLSAGIMFEEPTSKAQADQRRRYEVLAEIMQHKGASECFFDPLGNTDELCAFERLDHRSMVDSSAPQKSDGWLRETLLEGLTASVKFGSNPFEFGFIGSTDTHLGTPGLVQEKAFVGHGGAGLPARIEVPPGLPDYLQYNPGGLAVLWAEENRRASLFAAMQRREAYATSGVRMTVRLFAGTQLPADMCAGQFAELGYQHGTPMGGQVPFNNAAGAMKIAVSAAQDARSNGLERIQLIKGWLDSQGQTQVKVVDINSAATVAELDVSTCEHRGVSTAELCQVWEDPEFDANQPAWYYARVLEEPSCRWSQHMCVAAKVDCDNPETVAEGYEGCCDVAHRRTIRERAWTSPVWFQPDRNN